jgi:hypothetical protein
MAITISNLIVSNTVPAGTTIGVLTTTDASGAVVPCNYMLTKGSIGYFAIAGNNLVTAWSVPATPGHYSVRIRAIGSSTIFSGFATFTVDVGMAGSPPPPPPTIQINGSAGPVTVSAGATISATVANGPGNPGDWLGVYAVGAPTGTGNPASWKWLSTDDTRGSVPPAPGVTAGTVHLVVPAQAGQYEVRFFPNNSFAVAATSAAITVQITAPPPSPPTVMITVTPNTPQLPDTTPVGAVVATYTVTMSDGSPFVGTIVFGPPNFDAGGIFALTGSPTGGNIIVNPNGPGVGPNLSTVTDHITLIAMQP